MKTRTLTQVVKEEAFRIGFQLVGITTPTPPPHLDTYLNWLEKGQHAGMKWMATDRAREIRADPIKILPGCKSIIVLGIRYPKPLSQDLISGNFTENEKDRGGKIASYALGTDYHDMLPDRLRALVKFIEAAVGEPVSNRWYTDTGPILEKELARRAGLGWIGKNTCLINPKMGSYFLLAEIFLGIELHADNPIQIDYCGRCTRCLDRCPTGCINPDRTIDANQCISYLTIEHKGTIPENLRHKLGSWIFGCDICQQVCPWNQKFASDQHEPLFSARLGIPPVSLADELALTSKQFNHKFKGNPIKRTKRRGYLRNVVIAIANLDDSLSIPTLIETLKDPEPLIRSHVAWSLGKLGKVDALNALKLAYQQEKEPAVISEIEAALQNKQMY